MGPGMLDDAPKALGCLALILVAIAVAIGFVLGRL